MQIFTVNPQASYNHSKFLFFILKFFFSLNIDYDNTIYIASHFRNYYYLNLI